MTDQTRRYAVSEIDRMRWAIRTRFPMVYLSEFMGQPMKLTTEYDSQVEDQLRTYMLNGTEPEELEGLGDVGESSDEQKRRTPEDARQV